MSRKNGSDTTTAKSTVKLPLQASNDNAPIPVTEFPPSSVFEQSTTYPAIIIPVKRTAELRNTLSNLLLHRPKIKNVYPYKDDNSKRKLVLKSEEAWQDENVQNLLKDGCEKASHTITIAYADRTVEEVLRQLLPQDIEELPSAFEIVGKLAHLNLRDELLPYKYIVGKAILDKNTPRIRTVVNKLGSIANEYRTFGMEVIAGYNGPNWSLVSLKEEGCQFTLDFQQVYWNSRLGAEHRRLVKLIQKDAAKRRQDNQQPTVVADLMAGVGPFAVPLTASFSTKGKQKPKQEDDLSSDIVVHANDLNPASYKYLKINAEQNKCPADRLLCYNTCGRAFCHKLQADGDNDDSKPGMVEFHHAIMNLPASAPEFLDAFRGFTNDTLPRIHVYCFAPKFSSAKPEANGGGPSSNNKGGEDEEVEKAVLKRCGTALGCPLDSSEHKVIIRVVRDVSPNKNMLCVSFDLPEEVRKLSRIQIPDRSTRTADAVIMNEAQQEEKHNAYQEPQAKRTKMEQ